MPAKKLWFLDNKNPLSFYLTAKAAIGMKDDITAIAMLTKAIVLKEDIPKHTSYALKYFGK